MKRIAISVFCVSAGIIAYQLVLIRILSIIQWHHFAFMVISIALLGFGSSGTILSLFRDKILPKFGLLFPLFLLVCALSMVISPIILQQITFDPYLLIWDISQLGPLLAFCFLMFTPFLFGAIAIGLALIHYSEVVNKIYFANLVGSALGGILALGLLFMAHPFDLITVIAFITLISVVFTIPLANNRAPFIAILTLMSATVITLFFIFDVIQLRPSEYKSLSKTLLLPDAKIMKETTSPFGVLTVVQSDALRYAPGMSLSFQGAIPSQTALFCDGEWSGTILHRKEEEHIEFLNSTTSALPYHLKNNAHVLIIGVGTGTEVQLALQQGAATIHGVELNPQIINLITTDFAEMTSEIYNRPNVSITVSEARAFLSLTEKRFDIITIPLLEGFTASAAGLHSLFENYLFTLESFSLMFDRLSTDGILAITVWMNHPPRHSMKLLATLIEMLRLKGIDYPEQHLAGIRSWGTVTFVLSRTPFSETQISNIRTICETYFFDPILFPKMTVEETNRFNQLEHDWLAEAAEQLLTEDARSFYEYYPFFIKPSTDKQPYFSHFLTLDRIPLFFELLGREFVPFTDWGFVVLLATLSVVIFLSIFLILVPLLLKKPHAVSKAPKAWTLIYFSAIGIGYMFLEIVLIQKFILFLEHPIYSVSTIITGMLFFSGVGSYVSAGTFFRRRFLYIIGTLIILGLVYHFFLNEFLYIFVVFPLWIKYGIGILLVAPLAFCMGMPFPYGIKKLSEQSPSLLPWAWGINGCFSVVSAVLAAFLSIQFGFDVVFTSAMLCYGIVLMLQSYNLSHKNI